MKHYRGDWVVLDRKDAAALQAQVRYAVRYAWLERGLRVPVEFAELATVIALLAKQFREDPQVTALGETASAKQGVALPPLASTEDLTVDQAAAVMGVTEQYVRQLAREGTVSAVRVGEKGAWRVDSAAAVAWAMSRQPQRHREGLPDAQQPAARRTDRAA